MVALYRMPVFYLALLIVVCALGIVQQVGSAGSRSRNNSVESPGRPVADGAGDPLKTIAPGAKRESSSPPSHERDEILRTQDSLRRKVLIRDLDVVCLSGPQSGLPVGKPLDYFAIRYIYGHWPAGTPQMFSIGPREGPPQGWIPTSAVFEWDTRLMARPTPRRGRPPLVIYRHEDCLLDALAKRRCPRHKGHCPTEGEEPETQERASVAGMPALGMPILGTRAIPLPDGTTRTLFEVASMVRDQAPIVPPAAPPPDLVPDLRQIDIAFVVDTTASMQAAIAAVQQLAAQPVRDATQRYRDVTLKLALVEYRDAAPYFGFQTRTVTDFTTPARFQHALSFITAAPRGDGSIDEAVLDGVAEALPAQPGESRRAQHLTWPPGRSGELATKLMVLLGDAPDHARELTRTKALAAWAKTSGIMIATVDLERPGHLSRNEHERYTAQWRTLAEESFRPLDKSTGFAQPVVPARLTLAQADKLLPQLQSLIDDRVEHARNLAALAAAEAEGRLAAYVNSLGLTLDQIAPVLVDLHRGDVPVPARPDPRRGGRKAPSVRRGWIAERNGGAALVTVEMLMSRAELDLLIDELTQWQQAAQGSARDLSDLLSIGTAAATGETGFLAADRGSQTFAEHLRRRQGLPAVRADSLLQRTQAELLQADDSYRSALDARLSAALAALIRRRNESDWNYPRRTVDSMALVPYAWIEF